MATKYTRFKKEWFEKIIARNERRIAKEKIFEIICLLIGLKNEISIDETDITDEVMDEMRKAIDFCEKNALRMKEARKPKAQEVVEEPIVQKVVEEPPHEPIQTEMFKVEICDAEPQEKRFKKPTVEEIDAYIKANNKSVDAQEFFNHYESVGWKIGKSPMKNWHSAIATWERNGRNGFSSTRKIVINSTQKQYEKFSATEF